MLSTPEYFPVFPSSYLSILLEMIIFTNNKCFGLADIGQRRPEGNTTIGGE
jgi:hypothetical protein